MQRLKENPNTSHSTLPTIFDTLLSPPLNKNRPVPSNADLTAEAILMFLAGTDTTANSLVVGTYGILQNQIILEKLTRELRHAFPYPEKASVMTYDRLRKLPYLVRYISTSYASIQHSPTG